MRAGASGATQPLVWIINYFSHFSLFSEHFSHFSEAIIISQVLEDDFEDASFGAPQRREDFQWRILAPGKLRSDLSLQGPAKAPILCFNSSKKGI